MKKRYEIKWNSIGPYFYDNKLKKKLVFSEVKRILNDNDRLINNDK